MAIKPNAILSLMAMAYKLILRDLLKKAIDDPNSEWDETVLKISHDVRIQKA